MGLPFSVLPDLRVASLAPPGSSGKPGASKGDRLAFANALSQVQRPETKAPDTAPRTPDSPEAKQETPKDSQGAVQPTSEKPEETASDVAPPVEDPQDSAPTQATAQNLEAVPVAPAPSAQEMAQFASLLVQAPVQPVKPNVEGVQLAKSLTILSAQDNVAQATMVTLNESKPTTEFAGLQAQATPPAPPPATPQSQELPVESRKASDFATKMAAAQVQIPGVQQASLPQDAKPQLAQLVDAKVAPQLADSNPSVMPQVAAAVQQPPVQPAAQKSVAPQVEVARPADVAVQAKPEAVLDPSAVEPAKQSQQESNPDGPSEGQSEAARQAPKPPVSPVASQSAPQSVASLRAAAQMTSLRPENRMEPAESRFSEPAPESAPAVSAESLEPTAGTPEIEVHPWELPQGVQKAETPTARPLEHGVPRGEALPMREAMKTPFLEAAKHPGKPAEIRLELAPEHLGRMEIRVMAHEGTVSAQIKVDHAGTRELMQVQLAELRTSLADQGIKIDKLEVNVGQDQRRSAPDFDMGQSFQQAPGQGHQQQPHATPTGSHSLNFGGYDADSEEEALMEGGRHALAGGTAGIDFQA